MELINSQIVGEGKPLIILHGFLGMGDNWRTHSLHFAEKGYQVHVIDARNHGHIINLSSIAGTYPYPGGNVYGGTKAFVTQFSLNLRADLAGKNIRVTSVEPGLCGGTEFSNVRFKGDDARAEKLYENVQYVTPQDIANMVLWLNQQPEHVNINRIEVMPTAQTFAPLNVARNSN